MIGILIVDDDPLVRGGLAMMLREFSDLQVVGTASDGAEAASAVQRWNPAVVLMDIRMPGIDGLTATMQLRSRPNAPQVIVLTTFDTDEHIRRALRVGACGFLLKHTPPDLIAQAIRRVAAGEPMLSAGVLRRVMAIAAEPDPDPRQQLARQQLGTLSPSERRVAELIGQGKSNQEIAQQLRISAATVKSHVSHILTRFDLSNRVQIALLVHDAQGASG